MFTNLTVNPRVRTLGRGVLRNVLGPGFSGVKASNPEAGGFITCNTIPLAVRFACAMTRAVLGGGGGGFVTPTETNAHGNALCFLVMGRSVLQRLAVGGWRLVVGGPWGLSFRAVLSKKKNWLLNDSPGHDIGCSTKHHQSDLLLNRIGSEHSACLHCNRIWMKGGGVGTRPRYLIWRGGGGGAVGLESGTPGSGCSSPSALTLRPTADS